MGLDSCNQRGDGIDITPPKLLTIPFGFYRSSSASAEDVRYRLYVYFFLFGVSQGFGCDKRREFRRVTMNSVDRFFFLIPEVPVYRRIPSATHDFHRIQLSADRFVSRVSTQSMRIRPNIRANRTFRQGYAVTILSPCTRVSYSLRRAGQEPSVQGTPRIGRV